MSLSSVNGNKTKGVTKMILPLNPFNKDEQGNSGVAQTSNFASNGEIIYEFQTSATQTCPTDNIFFEIKDFFSLGTNAVPAVTNTGDGIGDYVLRSWNHCACLFSNLVVEINNTVVENISLVAETDSYIKRSRYSDAWLNSFGVVQGLATDPAIRKEFRQAPFQSFLWHPDCSALCTNQVIPQNCTVRFRLQPHQNYLNRAITVSSGNTTYGTTATDIKYGVDRIRMFVYLEEGDVVEPNSSKILELRPVKGLDQQFVGASAGEDTKFYEIPYTTYELGLGITAYNKNSSLRNAPSEFIERDLGTNQISQYQMSYASQIYPEYSSNMKWGSDFDGPMREYMLSYIMANMHYDDAGALKFKDWAIQPLFIHRVVKREDDKSTRLQLRLVTENSGGLRGNFACIFASYQKYVQITYDEAGRVFNVNPELV